MSFKTPKVATRIIWLVVAIFPQIGKSIFSPEKSLLDHPNGHEILLDILAEDTGVSLSPDFISRVTDNLPS